jgi:AMMECR1 domain-containing protein
LPQVATEYRWDRLTFLEQTCGKAGLPPDAWKDAKTLIYIFTAEIFGDNPQRPGCLRQERKSP